MIMNDKIKGGGNDDDDDDDDDYKYGYVDDDVDDNGNNVAGETIPVSPRPGCLSSCLHNQAMSTG